MNKYKHFLLFVILVSILWRPSFYVGELHAQDEDSTLAICSFNIQFLGQSVKRDNIALVTILHNFDIVLVQELVAPPFDGTFPDGTPFRPDQEAAQFFNLMSTMGFEHQLSLEDTGTGQNNHNNSSATEWWVAFFKPGKVRIAAALPSEFLANDRTDHNDYERVPHSFAFSTPDNTLDFVLISVHLKPGSSSRDAARRKTELAAIAQWVDSHDAVEKDFIILGDMNIEDAEELRDAAPRGFSSLNDECRATNTNLRSPKPYDHVMFRSRFTKEIDRKFDFRVYNLIEAMRPFWNSAEPYPGGALNPIALPAYHHNNFRFSYSDHHPVVFKMIIPAADDDG